MLDEAVLMQAENEHFIVLHLTGMDAGSNGDHAFRQNMRKMYIVFF